MAIESVLHRLLFGTHTTFSGNMKVLVLNRHISTLNGICSLPEGSGARLIIVQHICTFSIFATLIPCVGMSAAYAVEHFRLGDIVNSLFALIQVLGLSSTLFILVSLMLQKKSVRHFFERIQTIFDKCRNIRLQKCQKINR